MQAQMTPSTEMPTPTPAAKISNVVDLTTPPKEMVKQEPKMEKEASPMPMPAQVPHRRRNHWVKDSSSSEDVPRQENQLFPNRPVKKKPRGEQIIPAVEGNDFCTVITQFHGKDLGYMAELVCIWCKANCSLTSGVEVLFNGVAAWRNHVKACHKSKLPEGTVLTNKYVLRECIQLNRLTAQQEQVVWRKEGFPVVKKIGPGAEAGSSTRGKPNKKAKVAAAVTKAEEEDEEAAEREIMEAFSASIEERETKREGSLALGNVYNSDDNDDDHVFWGEDEEDSKEGVKGRTLGMTTRGGGRRTRRGPDDAFGKVE
jgi:hypothetical protein